MNWFKGLFKSKGQETKKQQPTAQVQKAKIDSSMKNVVIKSTMQFRFENGDMTDESPMEATRDVYATRDAENPGIYHVAIKNPEDDTYIMAPKAMKIAKNEGVKITLEGLSDNDPDNIWNSDFSDYGIQFSMNAKSTFTGQPGMASLLLKDRGVLITYQ